MMALYQVKVGECQVYILSSEPWAQPWRLRGINIGTKMVVKLQTNKQKIFVEKGTI